MKKNVILNSLALVGVGVITGVAIKKVNKYFNKVEKMSKTEKVNELNRILPEIQMLLIIAALWTLNSRINTTVELTILNRMQITDNMDRPADEKIELFKMLKNSIPKHLRPMVDEYINYYMEVK